MTNTLLPILLYFGLAATVLCFVAGVALGYHHARAESCEE